MRKRRTGVTWPELLALVLLTVGVRAIALRASHAPVADGDWAVYARVAGNILSGCGVSLSVPGSGACAPQFGGNGLPGYPFFIAAIWAIAGPSKIAVLWAQLVVSALAVPRLAYAMVGLAGRRVGLVCGLVAAVSPLQASMVRYGLAECLTMGTATCLFAELALCLGERRLRVMPVAGWMAIGLFLRLDFVAFLAPVAMVGLAIHGTLEAVRRGVVLAALMCVPVGVWTARNVVDGVSVLPPARGWMLPDGTIGPLGYLGWLKQWVTTADQRAATMFFAGYHYDMIHLLPSWFRPADQDGRVDALLRDLRTQDGRPFPPDIDEGFAALAAEMTQSRGVTDGVALRAAQAWGFWRSWAEPLPPELRPGGPLSGDLVWRWAKRSFTNGAGSLMNTVTRGYRLLLGAGFIAAVIASALRRQRQVLVWAAVSLVAAKTVIGVAGLFLEPRYTMTAVPAIDVAVFAMGKARPSFLKKEAKNLC